LAQHNEGMVNFTSKYMPWELVYFETFETRAEALKKEKFFKTGKGREFIKSKINQL
jgi:putative endonuclease